MHTSIQTLVYSCPPLCATHFYSNRDLTTEQNMVTCKVQHGEPVSFIGDTEIWVRGYLKEQKTTISPKPTPVPGTSCTVAAPQVGECLFKVTRLVYTSSRKLSWFLLLQAAGLVSESSLPVFSKSLCSSACLSVFAAWLPSI